MPIPSNVFNDAVRGFWNQRIAQLSTFPATTAAG